MQEPTKSIVRVAAALAIVAVVMWQLKERRDADLAAAPKVVVTPKPAASSPVAVTPAAPAERTEAEKSSIVEEAERAVALAKAKEEAEKAEAAKKSIVAPEPAKTAKAADTAVKPEPAPQRKTGAVATVAEPAPPLMSDRTKLVVQTEAAPPSGGGPGVRPMPRSAQAEEKAMAYPSFPGCRWATPTQWVCDGAKQQ